MHNTLLVINEVAVKTFGELILYLRQFYVICPSAGALPTSDIYVSGHRLRSGRVFALLYFWGLSGARCGLDWELRLSPGVCHPVEGGGFSIIDLRNRQNRGVSSKSKSKCLAREAGEIMSPSHLPTKTRHIG